MGRGCEFWRALSAEWHGSAPQLRDAKARRYLEPPRCKDTNELWSKLPAWERLGEEVMLSDLILPEWMRNVALEKLLPAQLLSTLVSRSELVGYSVRLAWVKTQMEHARGIAQAAAYGPGTGKDASGDVYMNSVEAAAAAEPSDGLAWALANAVEQGDWAQAESLQVAILAVKGGGKGGYRKGLGKGKPASPAAAAKGGSAGAGFNGNCNHCGIWGHRRSECRRLDQEMGKKGGAKGDKGGGKGDKGGKGGPKGGKGPPSDPLMECAAADEGDWAAALAAAGDGDYTDEEWCFDNTIASLAPWVQVPAKHGRRSAPRCPSAADPREGGRGAPPGVAAVPTTKATLMARVGKGTGRATHCSDRSHDQSGLNVAGRFGPLQCGNPTQVQGAGGTTRCSDRSRDLGRLGPLQRGNPTPVQNKFDALNLLIDDAALLGAVSGETRGGRVVEAVVDSGAVHCVTPPGLFPGKVLPSPWSRAGRGYRAANGTGIKNLGQVSVPFATAEGHRCRIPFQVAEVEQPLMSVAHLTSAGNLVQLGDTDGHVINLGTGRSIALERRGNIYYMKMFIADAASPLPFRRQGA